MPPRDPEQDRVNAEELESGDFSDTVLVVVDVQNDFLPGGALAVPDGDKILPVVNRWIAAFDGLPIYLTRDWHPEGTPHFETWPPHCRRGTWGAAFPDGLVVPEAGVVVSKGLGSDHGYSPFEGNVYTLEGPEAFIWNLIKLAPRKAVVVGLATDYCVDATVKDLIDNRMVVRVDPEGVRAVDPASVDETFARWRSQGVVIKPLA